MTKSLLAKIEEIYPTLSKSHKKIADFILDDYAVAAFITAAKLGETVGISESTVVRFATELGFSGYPQLQKSLQELIRNKLTSVQRMEVTNVRISEDDVLRQVLTSDMDMIRETLDSISTDTFKKCTDAINNAKRIYILGLRSSASLASFLAFYFNLVFDDVILLDTSSPSEMFEQIFRINENDVCIAISFPRYSKQIVNALKFISDRKATIISITDSDRSPIAAFATHVLTAKSDIASFVDSLVAPLSLINALIVAVSLGRKETVYRNFNMLENIWDEYRVYEKVENNE